MLKVKNAVLDGEIVCLDSEGRSIFNDLLHRKGFPAFYAFDLIYLDDRDLRQLPLMKRKRKLRELLGKNNLADVICGKYVEGRGIDFFTEVCLRNLEGIVAKRKSGTYSTISGWLKIKNPNYTQPEQHHELFESFMAKTLAPPNLPPIPKKPPRRAITSSTAIGRKSLYRARRSHLQEELRRSVLETMVATGYFSLDYCDVENIFQLFIFCGWAFC